MLATRVALVLIIAAAFYHQHVCAVILISIVSATSHELHLSLYLSWKPELVLLAIYRTDEA